MAHLATCSPGADLLQYTGSMRTPSASKWVQRIPCCYCHTLCAGCCCHTLRAGCCCRTLGPLAHIPSPWRVSQAVLLHPWRISQAPCCWGLSIQCTLDAWVFPFQGAGADCTFVRKRRVGALNVQNRHSSPLSRRTEAYATRQPRGSPVTEAQQPRACILVH